MSGIHQVEGRGARGKLPGAPIPLGGTGESGLVELRVGTIYHNSRTHSRPGNRRVAYSKDAGETRVDEHEDDELSTARRTYKAARLPC